MTELTHLKIIRIGGIECPAVVRYRDVFGFLKAFRKEVLRYKDRPAKDIIIRNEFFFGVVWKCLIKTGFLWWEKPFRSKRHMINSILYDEINEITMFVSKYVLPSTGGEESKKKEVQQGH